MGTFKASFKDGNPFNASFGNVQKVSTSNYEELYNLPYMNGEKIIGHKVSHDYHLQDEMEVLSQTDIEKILYVG